MNNMRTKVAVILASVILASVIFGGIAFAWAPFLDGRPSEYRPGHTVGYFIWRDADGFNFRSTSNRHGHVFTGVLRTNGQFVDVRAIRDEAGDRLRVDSDSNEIRFHFRTTPNDADGFDFRIHGGNRLHLTLYIDGQPIPASAIHLGASNQHPQDHNFVLVRHNR